MKTLWLLRHAKSAWNTNAPSDHQRPLAKRGRRDALAIGAWLAARDVRLDRIACSTAIRTRQTLAGVRRNYSVDDTAVIFADAIYHAGSQDLLTVIHAATQAETSLLLIGHNPGLDSVLIGYCGPDLPLSTGGKLMTTAALAQIELDGWQARHGRLLNLIRPKEL